MNGARPVRGWLVGIAVGSIVLVAVRSNLSSLAIPFLIGMTVFLLLQASSRTSQRFPGTDLERGLERLFALLFPQRKATTTTTALVELQRQMRLAGLRRGARRWGKQLQMVTTDGYETASRLSALCVPTGQQDDRVLVAEAVRVLRAERASAGADMTLVNDPLTVLAYGLGARPAAADLTSLEELLDDLGLSGDGDELRTHFDDVVAAETDGISLHLKNQAERSMFRELAGASFVLGASARILELASPRSTPSPVAAAG